MKLKTLFMFFIIFIISTEAMAFSEHTYDLILNDVISFCPPELQNYIRDNIKDINSGLTFMDRQGHQAKVDPTQVMTMYNYLVQQLQKEPLTNDSNTVNKFGILASFVVTSINPSRKISTTQPQATQPQLVIYDGYQKIDEQRVKSLSIVPTNDAYNKAVNEIADFWISAWEDGNRGVSRLYPTGIMIDYRPKRGFAQSEVGKQLDAERQAEAQSKSDMTKTVEMEKRLLEERKERYENNDYRGLDPNRNRKSMENGVKRVEAKQELLEKDPEYYFYKKGEQQASPRHSEASQQTTLQNTEADHTKVDPQTGTVYVPAGRSGNYINTKTGGMNIKQGGGLYLDTKTGEVKRID